MGSFVLHPELWPKTPKQGGKKKPALNQQTHITAIRWRQYGDLVNISLQTAAKSDDSVWEIITVLINSSVLSNQTEKHHDLWARLKLSSGGARDQDSVAGNASEMEDYIESTNSI